MSKYFVSLGTALVLFGLVGCESEADKVAKIQMEEAKKVTQRAEAARKRARENTYNPINEFMAQDTQKRQTKEQQ